MDIDIDDVIFCRGLVVISEKFLMQKEPRLKKNFMMFAPKCLKLMKLVEKSCVSSESFKVETSKTIIRRNRTCLPGCSSVLFLNHVNGYRRASSVCGT